MNDIFYSSFREHQDKPQTHGDIEMGLPGMNLDKFYKDVETIEEELKQMEFLHQGLRAAHEECKLAHQAKTVKELRARMHKDLDKALKKAKLIKVQLDRLNAANPNLPEGDPVSTEDRIKSSLIAWLTKKLKEKMDEFQELREKIGSEYKEIVERRYFTVTGENPDEKTIDLLISTGESETFLQKVIHHQGRGQILDIIAEIKERHDAAIDIEKNLKELHEVFLDMAVLVKHQGEELDNIQYNVGRATSFVKRGTAELQKAKKAQKNTRKWTCFAIILLLIVALIIVLSLHPWKK